MQQQHRELVKASLDARVGKLRHRRPDLPSSRMLEVGRYFLLMQLLKYLYGVRHAGRKYTHARSLVDPAVDVDRDCTVRSCGESCVFLLHNKQRHFKH